MQRKTITPAVDSKPLYDVVSGALGFPAVFVAHELKLFDLLAEEPMPLDELALRLRVDPRGLKPILDVNLALDLIDFESGRYCLTQLASEYLVSSSACYFGGLLDLIVANQFSISIDALKKAVLSNSPQAYGNGDIFKSHEEAAEQAKAFTRAMHSLSAPAAGAWPRLVDLSGRRSFLDIGGGSGVHAIEAVRRWPHLRAIVFDIGPVCEVAGEYIRAEEFDKQIETVPGNFWEDRFPEADIHFYSQIFHDWPEDKCLFLMKKSFEQLPENGKIVIHEILFNDDKRGPFVAAASSVAMLLWTQGRQYSGKEFGEMLSQVGFSDVQVKPAFSYWSVVVAEKR